MAKTGRPRRALERPRISRQIKGMTGTDDPREQSRPATADEIAPEWFQTLEPAMRRIARDVVETYLTESGQDFVKIDVRPTRTAAGPVAVQDVRSGVVEAEIKGLGPDVVDFPVQAEEDPQVLEASRIYARINSELAAVEAQADRLLKRYNR